MLFYLLNFVKKYLDAGKSLTEAFGDFARNQGYTAKSVKKCFKLAVEGFDAHPKLAKWLDMDLQELKNPANAFNMTAVKDFILKHDKNADKCFFAICFGNVTEATALKKRFDKFFPDFFEEENNKNAQKNDLMENTTDEEKSADTTKNSFPLQLQSRFYDTPPTDFFHYF